MTEEKGDVSSSLFYYSLFAFQSITELTNWLCYDQDFADLLQPFYYGKGLTDPINTAKDKWNLLPAFLKVKGFVKQHIDSFNFFVDIELKNIVRANQWVYSDVDHKFWLKWVLMAVTK